MRSRYPKPGVYKITNTVSGKFYIGSSTLNVYYRWDDHKSQLRTGIHANIHLQRAWDKHGQDAFTFEVLEYCNNVLDREQFWIDTLQPTYNICKEAKNSAGVKRSQETCSRIGKSKLGNKHRLGTTFTDEVKGRISTALKKKYADGLVHPMLGKSHTASTIMHLANAKKGNSIRRDNPTYRDVEKYDLSGNFIVLYATARLAADSVGAMRKEDSSRILHACRRPDTRSAFGYKWRFKHLKDQIKPGELLEACDGNQQPSATGM